MHCALVFFRLLEKSNPFALSLSKDAFPFYKGGLHRGVQRGIYPSARGLGVSPKKDSFVIARSPSLGRTTKQSLGWVKEMAIRLLRPSLGGTRNDKGFRLGD